MKRNDLSLENISDFKAKL